MRKLGLFLVSVVLAGYSMLGYSKHASAVDCTAESSQKAKNLQQTGDASKPDKSADPAAAGTTEKDVAKEEAPSKAVEKPTPDSENS